MYNLGIMQGRIYPANKKKYNLFPLSWETEINKLKKVGFDYVELLYDREESTNNPICRNSSYLGKLTQISKGKLYSINLDYFTKNNFFTYIIKPLVFEPLSTYSKLVSNSGLNLVSLEISNSSSSSELKPRSSQDSKPNEVSFFKIISIYHK